MRCWDARRRAALQEALTVVGRFEPATAAEMARLLRRGTVLPMPPWLRRVLFGAVGLAIPVFDVVFVWPPQCDDTVALVALLVHEHHHLRDGWRAWVYALISLWNTRLREHGAYAAELAFLERWDAAAADPALHARIAPLTRWIRSVLRNLETRGRLR